MKQAFLLSAILALPGFVYADDHEEAAAAAEETMEKAEEAVEEAPAMEESADSSEEGPSYEFQGWLDQEITFDQSGADGGQAAYGLFEVGFRASHAINKNFGGALQINGRWDQTLTASGEGNAMSIAPREAYAYWQNDSEKVRVQAGKWFVPIGFELADPPDLYQFSNSNQFGFFLPTEAVGLISYLTFTDMLDLALYISGGFDDDFSYQNGFNTVPSIGERLGVSFGDAGVGLSLVVSDSSGDESYNSILVDVDFAAEMDALTLGGEFSLLTDTDSDDAATPELEGATDFGVMAMASYGVNDRLTVTGRVDVLDGDSFADTEVGLTAAGLINFAPGWDLVLEIREDINDADVGKNNLTGAFELIWQFL